MKKNGFVFAETIIVMAVVLTGLIMLYSTFSNVLQRERIKSTYNQAIDIYHLNTIKNYLQAIESNYYYDNQIIPRGTGTPVNINTGHNSDYFRLECQCHDLVNEAYIIKYPYILKQPYCEDNYDPIYFNYCADLINHVDAKDIYIIRNTRDGIEEAITQILADEASINDECINSLGEEETCFVTIGARIIYTPTFSGTTKGIPRRVNVTLIDYLKTLSPITSTVETEDWSNDFIIVGEFFRDGTYSYASLRYEG